MDRRSAMKGGMRIAEIFEFPPCGDEGAPAAGSRKELLAYLASVEEQIDQLNQQEPPGMSGEEYEAWADRHEELEDLADDLRDRLDELGGSHD